MFSIFGRASAKQTLQDVVSATEIKSFDKSTLRHTETKVTFLDVDPATLQSSAVTPVTEAEETNAKASGESWLEGFLAASKDSGDHERHLTATRVHNRGFAIKLEDVLSPEECQYLIDRCEKKGFEPALLNIGFGRQILDTSTRNNERCIHDDPRLCDELWRRISPFVAQCRPQRVYKGSKRVMVARELNERLRVLKYTSEPGNPNYFKAHCDGSYPRPRNHPKHPDVSRYTVLIYLNGGIEGGSTRLYRSSDESLYEDCFPSAGRVLIHDHHILHEGMPVKEGKGTKYVIRTDIMCTIQTDTDTDETIDKQDEIDLH